MASGLGSVSTTDVLLTALGKTWGKLLDGRVLEVRRGDLVVRFDLCQTAALGRPVLEGELPDEYCNASAAVID